MKPIYVTIPKTAEMRSHYLTFRTSDNGEYLFFGAYENKQIACDGGYGNNRKTRQKIRDYTVHWLTPFDCPRLKYEFDSYR